MPLILSRRRFLAAATVAASGVAVPSITVSSARAAAPIEIRATRRTIEVNGRSASVLGLLQPDGRHGLIVDMADSFRVRLLVEMGEPTLVHWHGLAPPYRQDGVPGISAPPIAPGASANYDFPLAFPGTFWMHSHQGLQEQSLLSAPLIVHGPEDRGADHQEVVLMLHDFSFTPPTEIYAGLRLSAPKADNMKTGAMSPKAINQTGGMASGKSSGMAHQSMSRMGQNAGTATLQHSDAGASGMKMDLNDVVYDAFLANDRTLADPDVTRVAPGGRILLRIINGSAASNFVVDLGQLRAELVAVDGHKVEPVRGSTFPIAIAQRIDLLLRLPRGQAAWPVFATLEGSRRRTGIVLATAQARIAKVIDQADKITQPLNLSLEKTLRAAEALPDRKAGRVHRVDLTGSMQTYVWSLNGRAYPDAPPLMVKKGERVEVVMRNTTMMSHPMHLHGHFFQVIAVDGRRFRGARRDTVLVPPMATVTIAFDADNPGKWAFHCHNLYHQEAGMMTTVVYQGI